MNRIDLAGRRAVITGGAQGVGLAVAERFLASGAAVSLWDRDGALLERTRAFLAGRGTVDGRAIDVTRAAEVEEAAAMIAWLVSRENSFTTGAVFDLSGGRATY